MVFPYTENETFHIEAKCQDYSYTNSKNEVVQSTLCETLLVKPDVKYQFTQIISGHNDSTQYVFNLSLKLIMTYDKGVQRLSGSNQNQFAAKVQEDVTDQIIVCRNSPCEIEMRDIETTCNSSSCTSRQIVQFLNSNFKHQGLDSMKLFCNSQYNLNCERFRGNCSAGSFTCRGEYTMNESGRVKIQDFLFSSLDYQCHMFVANISADNVVFLTMRCSIVNTL